MLTRCNLFKQQKHKKKNIQSFRRKEKSSSMQRFLIPARVAHYLNLKIHSSGCGTTHRNTRILFLTSNAGNISLQDCTASCGIVTSREAYGTNLAYLVLLKCYSSPIKRRPVDVTLLKYIILWQSSRSGTLA